MGGHDLGAVPHVDVRARRELLDQVLGHALLEIVASAKDRDRASVAREGDRRLSRRVARSDDVDVDAVRRRSVGPGCAVEDALAGKPAEALDRQLTPGDSASEDDRLTAQDVAAVQVYLATFGVDPCDFPRHENLCTQPSGLLE